MSPRRALSGAAVVLACLAPTAQSHMAAATLLSRVAADDPTADIDVHDEEIATESGPLRARYYGPHTAERPPALVVVHGVHALGMNEPRLVRLARAFARSGFAVLTPHVEELADYSLRPTAVRTIGESARALADRVHEPRVGVLGISFGGGLAVVAAADSRYDARIGYVATLGAHHDLGRVLRYFATDRIEAPDGTLLERHAHDYGPLVLVYGRLPLFFGSLDVPLAREALRLWLAEDFEQARAWGRALSTEGRTQAEVLFAHHVKELAPLLELAALSRDADARASSPSGAMARLRVPLFALHGADDDVVPPTEALWLDASVPRNVPHAVLVTSALAHANVRASSRLWETARLVHFLAELRGAAYRVRWQ